MIAYNYCYSTCLGRVVDFKGKNKLGVIDLARVPGLLGSMEENINGSYRRSDRQTLLTGASCTKWDDLCKASCPKGIARTDVERAPRH